MEETKTMTAAEKREQIAEANRERLEKIKESREAQQSGAGRMKLEHPITSGEDEITELIYDFTAITGMDYVEAMDSDKTTDGTKAITYRQGLALFGKAVEKQMPGLDMRDIVERMAFTDAAFAVKTAKDFFYASLLAGQLRISKK